MKKKLYAVALAVGLLVGFVAPSASAGTAYGTWLYNTTNGVQYQGRSIIITGSASGSAQTVQGPTSTSVPSGWAGALPRAYNSGGGLKAQGSWCYNSGTLPAGGVVGCSVGFSGNGTYNSTGLLAAWLGSAYNTYTSLQSPNQSIPG